MNGLDIVIVLVLLGGSLYGYRLGAVRQLAGGLGWLGGVATASIAANPLRLRLEERLALSGEVITVLSFLSVTLAVVVFAKLVGILMHRWVSRSRALRAANVVIGAVVGAAATAVVVAVMC